MNHPINLKTDQSISLDVLQEKYCKGKEVTKHEIFRRVADAVSKAEKPAEQSKWADIFYKNMWDGALGAGRIMSSAGTDIEATLINCFVQPVGDSMDGVTDGKPGIYKALTMAAETMRRGGGVGYNFSAIRPKGSLVRSTHSEASGPCSYMNVFDKSCETVESAGTRRGAQMGVLNINHPDIFEFITAKRTEGRWNNFNVSVGVTDDFMIAVQNKSVWQLVHKATPSDKQFKAGAYRRDDCMYVYAELPATELYDLIMKSTYDYAEPGIIFFDTINRDNNLIYVEDIDATNPCAEQPLPDYGCCDLGPIILTRFIENPFSVNAKFNFEYFLNAVAIQVRFLDNVLDVTYWPLKEQQMESNKKRRIGVGYTALGDALIMLGIKYNSEEGYEFARNLTQQMQVAAYVASIELAKTRGSFPLFEHDKYLAEGTCASRLPDNVKAQIRLHGIRNSHLLSIAPVGTVSLAFADNASNGIEPAFSWCYNRRKRMADGSYQTYPVMDHAFRVYVSKLEPAYARGLIDAICDGRDFFVIDGTSYYVDEALPSAFINALQIPAEDHVRMLKVVQPYVDSAISKTVNIPADYPFEDFKNLYMSAWLCGLKGLATYRPNATLGSVLSTPVAEVAAVPAVLADVDPATKLIDKSPEGVLEAVRIRIKYMTNTGEKSVYVIMSFLEVDGVLDGIPVKVTRPIEVFTPDSQMDVPHEYVSTIFRQLSINARSGLIATALKDIRQVRSADGAVRYDWYVKADGTKVPLWHKSEMGVIAYAVQQVLIKRGFLDELGNQMDSRVLAYLPDTDDMDDAHENVVEVVAADTSTLMPGKPCGECGAHAVIKKDGCTFCTSCGYLGSCG